MNSDSLKLRETNYPPLTNNDASLSATEFDQNYIKIYDDLVRLISASGILAYNGATEYDETTNSLVSYNSRLYRFIFASPATGIVPTNTEYWLETFPNELAHEKNRDQKLDEGGVNEVTAAQLKAVVDGTSLLFTGLGTYTDTSRTSGSPLIVTGLDPAVVLPNNGAISDKTQLPDDVTTFLADAKVIGQEGDGINVSISFAVKLKTAKPTWVDVTPFLGETAQNKFKMERFFNKGIDVVQYFGATFEALVDSSWEANGMSFAIESTENVEVYDIEFVITRTHKAKIL